MGKSNMTKRASKAPEKLEYPVPEAKPKTKKKTAKKTIAKGKAAPKKTATKAKKEKKGYKSAKAPYMFFCIEERPKILKKTPGMAFGEVGKALGAAWAKLKDKSKYEKLAEKDKARAAKDKAAWEK